MAGQNRCIDLALEGERKCRSGDTKSGITYLEAALAAGTDDLRTLSAIYSQLGNAYFYLGDYMKALEYHRHDLTLARTIGDTLGEAKASGNLGNTLKVLGKFDEAIVCCQRHLEICRDLKDKVGEARALYNLGNVYHAKGKHVGRLTCASSASDSGAEFPAEVKAALRTAVDFYEANLKVVEELGDKAGKGRACGNLGNTHYLLGQFEHAVRFHQLRLQLAKEFGDKAAMRRAYSNLGNAHVFLGEFDKALEYYKKALSVALEMNDKATEAQACYSLGNTCTLMGEHGQAVDYHVRHMRIARQLSDRVGEARACWSLGNAFTSLGDKNKATYFVLLHYHLSQEIGDYNGESVAQRNLSELGDVLSLSPDRSADPEPLAVDELEAISKRAANDMGSRSSRRSSMEKMERWRLTPTSATESSSLSADKPSKLSLSGRTNAAKDVLEVSHIRPQFTGNTPEEVLDADQFFELLCRVQDRRIDDQRCDPRTLNDNKENRPRVRATDSLKPARRRLSIGRVLLRSVRRMHDQRPSLRPVATSTPALCQTHSLRVQSPRRLDRRLSLGEQRAVIARTLPSLDQSPDEFLEMIAGIQGRRMDDQRAALEFLPGLQDPQRVLGPHLEKRRQSSQDSQAAAASSSNDAPAKLDDDFVDMLMRCQSTRIDEQRSELPKKPPPAPTVPEDDFFSLIMKMQSARFDDQRTALAPSSDNAAKSSSVSTGPPPPQKSPKSSQKPAKRTASQKIKNR